MYVVKKCKFSNHTNINEFHELEGWYRYETVSKNVIFSPLPDLPKRPFLSPWGREAEEFTVIIPVTMDAKAISFLEDNPSVIPGMHFAVIGENWEVYLNGTVVKSEMHFDKDAKGKIKIKERRTWRNVSFPMDRNIIKEGTNILALRIIGDPSYIATGLSFRVHHYIDDYRIIEWRQNNSPLIVLCGIFGFTGIYYFMLFFAVRNRQEIVNLYFGLFSLLLCIYSFTRHSIVNVLIPNSDISVRLEFTSMILMIPVFCYFIESLVRGKITRVSKIYMIYCGVLALTQLLFSNQYGEDVVQLWNVTVIIYCTYFLFYKLIYFCFWDKNGPRASYGTHIVNAIVGMSGLYICGVYEILEVMFFRNDFSFFQYSIFAVQIGMAFYLAQRFSIMQNELNDSMQMASRVSEALNKLQKTKAQGENINIGNLKFDLVTNRAFYDSRIKSKELPGKELPLAPKEFALLYLLAKNEGKVLSAEYLYEKVWNLDYDKNNTTVRGHIKNIKKKLEPITNEILIEAVRGAGYRLAAVNKGH